jgi:two-component system chemotaxis response regulator CheV
MIEDIKTNDDFNEEDDELDIIKLVSTNANNSNQYLIFNGSNGELYAKNVSKIEELIVYKDLEIAHNSTGSLIIGTADVRGQMTPIVNFDEWFGNKVLDDSEYELVVLASYGGYRFGIVVKSVEYIVAIEPEDMVDNSVSNPKTTFITKVKVGSENRLCTIFDSDKMLLDIFENSEKSNLEKISNVTSKRVSEKLVLFADDSKFIREMVKKLLLTMELNYKIFEDGKHLIEEIKNINLEDLGVVVTDLEMPNLGGKDVIKFMREDAKFDDIKIIVHTNMSNNIMEEDLLEAGANQIIKKIDMEKLSEGIKKSIR